MRVIAIIFVVLVEYTFSVSLCCFLMFLMVHELAGIPKRVIARAGWDPCEGDCQHICSISRVYIFFFFMLFSYVLVGT